MTEFVCTDDNHCKNEGVCGRTRAGMCDCKPNYDLKPDCSGKLDDDKYLFKIKVTCVNGQKLEMDRIICKSLLT